MLGSPPSVALKTKERTEIIDERSTQFNDDMSRLFDRPRPILMNKMKSVLVFL